jgi:hypothetical protein
MKALRWEPHGVTSHKNCHHKMRDSHLQVYSSSVFRPSHANFWPSDERNPNSKRCNFCPIYKKLDFASDIRESRISISKKFLSAVPQLLSADDEVREAGDVTFHCEHAED